MPTPKDEIIELTDVIEEGPGAAGNKNDEIAEQGVDMSFEKELEELFSDSPAETAAPAKPAADPLEDLDFGVSESASDLDKAFDLDEEPKPSPQIDPGDQIDFDALGDFSEAAPPAPAASQPASPAADYSENFSALEERLQNLEGALSGLASAEELSGLRENLVSELGAKLDERLAEFTASLPAPVPALNKDELLGEIKAGLPDSQALMDELNASLEAKLDNLSQAVEAAKSEAADQISAWREELSQSQSPANESLSQELEDKIAPLAADLTALREDLAQAPSAESLSLELESKISPLAAELAALRAESEAGLAGLREELSQNQAPSAESIASSLREELDAKLAPLSDGLAAAREEASQLKQSLAGLKDEILAEVASLIPQESADSALETLVQDIASLRQAQEESREALQASLAEAVAAPQKLFEEFKQLIDSRLANLENEIEKKASQQELENLAKELDKNVTLAAAKVIREEIAALAESLID